MRISKILLSKAAQTFTLLIALNSFILSQDFDPKYWITNGNVFSIARSGNNIFLGGDFTYVGPKTNPFLFINKSTGEIDSSISVPDIIYNITVFNKKPQIFDVIKKDNSYYLFGRFSKVGAYNTGAVVKIDKNSNSLEVDNTFSRNDISIRDGDIAYKNNPIYFIKNGIIIQHINDSLHLLYDLFNNTEKYFYVSFLYNNPNLGEINEKYINLANIPLLINENEALTNLYISIRGENGYEYLSFITKINIEDILNLQDYSVYNLSFVSSKTYKNNYRTKYEGDYPFKFYSNGNYVFYIWKDNYNIDKIIAEKLDGSGYAIIDVSALPNFDNEIEKISIYENNDAFNFVVNVDYSEEAVNYYFSISKEDIDNAIQTENTINVDIFETTADNFYPYNLFNQILSQYKPQEFKFSKLSNNKFLLFMHSSALYNLFEDGWKIILFDNNANILFENCFLSEFNYYPEFIEEENHIILYGRSLTSYGGKFVKSFVCLNNETGKIVDGFNEFNFDYPSPHNVPSVIKKLAIKDNYVYLGGSFNLYNSDSSVVLTSLARYDITNKQIDWSFNIPLYKTYNSYSHPVISSFEIKDNILYLGGDFDKIGNPQINQNYISAINLENNTIIELPNITKDASPSYNDIIRFLKIVNDTLLFVGGNFASQINSGADNLLFFYNFAIINLNNDSVYYIPSDIFNMKVYTFAKSNYTNSIYIGGTNGFDQFLFKLNLDTLNLENLSDNLDTIKINLSLNWDGNIYPPLISKLEEIYKYLIIGGNFSSVSFNEQNPFETDNLAIFDQETNTFITNWNQNPDVYIWIPPAKPTKQNRQFKPTAEPDWFLKWYDAPVNDFDIDTEAKYIYIGGAFQYFGNNYNQMSFAKLPLPEYLPVELMLFTAKAVDNSVELKWSTANELNNYKFEIERKSLDNLKAEWKKIGEVKGSGNSSKINDYFFVDKFVAKGKYAYRLKQIDYDGSYKYSNTVEVEISKAIEFVLYQNYPNPFNPETTIRFSLAQNGLTKVELYNSLGQKVKTLLNKELEGNKFYEIKLDGTDLSSGVYFVRLIQQDKANTIKINLIK